MNFKYLTKIVEKISWFEVNRSYMDQDKFNIPECEGFHYKRRQFYHDPIDQHRTTDFYLYGSYNNVYTRITSGVDMVLITQSNQISIKTLVKNCLLMQEQIKLLSA